MDLLFVEVSDPFLVKFVSWSIKSHPKRVWLIVYFCHPAHPESLSRTGWCFNKLLAWGFRDVYLVSVHPFDRITSKGFQQLSFRTIQTTHTLFRQEKHINFHHTLQKPRNYHIPTPTTRLSPDQTNHVGHVPRNIKAPPLWT